MVFLGGVRVGPDGKVYTVKQVGETKGQVLKIQRGPMNIANLPHVHPYCILLGRRRKCSFKWAFIKNVLPVGILVLESVTNTA